MINDNKEHIIAMFVNQEQFVIHSKVLLGALGDREQVKEARSIVLGHQSLLTLMVISYVVINISM